MFLAIRLAILCKNAVSLFHKCKFLNSQQEQECSTAAIQKKSRKRLCYFLFKKTIGDKAAIYIKYLIYELKTVSFSSWLVNKVRGI